VWNRSWRCRTPPCIAGGFGLPDPEGLSGRIEEGFLRRARAFPMGTQQVLLLVAADPVGDASILQRATHTLGISLDEDMLARPRQTG